MAPSSAQSEPLVQLSSERGSERSWRGQSREDNTSVALFVPTYWAEGLWAEELDIKVDSGDSNDVLSWIGLTVCCRG